MLIIVNEEADLKDHDDRDLSEKLFSDANALLALVNKHIYCRCNLHRLNKKPL